VLQTGSVVVRTALLADLHANREAVEAVLAHADRQRIDGHALLGDFVGYGADPGWVVDTVRDLVRQGAVAVMGNHDQAVVQGATESMRPDPRYVVDWTRQRLDTGQLAFLAGLPMTAERGDVIYVHANAWAPGGWDYVHDRHQAARSLLATRQRITFCGHMHEPMLYHLSPLGKAGEFVPSSGVTIPLPATRQWLVIPGSAGQPRDGDPAACYAVHDDVASTITYWRVPYDVESAGAKIRAARLPQRLADRLVDGH
jgi:diadenosine tetraphosphatase ApaH/serine/threonine PP2A family protein phosphatase